MRDPNRIDGILNTVSKLWKLVPDWRLGQLVCNVAREAGYFDAFHIEDDKLVEVINKWVSEAERE